MDDFELEIKTEFINEALMNLEEAEGSFMELEGSSDSKPLLDKIFRLAHNLKGGSRAVGFGEVAEFTHQLENLVLKIQKNEVTLSSEVITTLLKSNDRLVEMLTGLKNDFTAVFDTSDLLKEIEKWIVGSGAPSVPETKIAPHASEPQPVDNSPKMEMKEEVPVQGEAQIVALEERPPAVPSADDFHFEEEPVIATPTPPVIKEVPKKEPPAPTVSKGEKGPEDEVIRVNLSRIDLLNDYVGELIVLQSVVQQQSLGADPAKLQATLRQVAKISKDIQSLSMSLRMLPVKPLIQKLQRVVRDTAQALGKDVALKLEGDQLEVDKSVIDRLSDPLIHILRNAVDHGLENTEDRVAQGKSPQGTVHLSFANEGNHLVVEVKDNGKGIDGEVLRKKAIEKGLISPSQSMTDKQLINLIFHPGFSTKAVTSEISGRGVGMDVVKTNVDKIGGQIDVQTKVGVGSTFRLQIPLSLAVIDGLVVTSESGRYVIPLNQVQQTVNLGAEDVFTDKLAIGTCFKLRGSIVPLVSIDEALGMNRKMASKEGTALIVNVQDRPMGLVVSDILRAQQIVIKPLSNGISAQKGWIGSCVLGDGLPTLILSPVDLLSGKFSFGLEENSISKEAG